jgi:predicted nicotinamide N-methyase
MLIVFMDFGLRPSAGPGITAAHDRRPQSLHPRQHARVLDLAAGSGLVAIAAARAGAAPVIAADIDAFTDPAIALNAEANDVYIEVLTEDQLDRPASRQPRYDVILVGDLSTAMRRPARACWSAIPAAPICRNTASRGSPNTRCR